MLRCVLIGLLLSSLGSALAEDIETLDHHVYKDVKISRAEPDGIVVTMKTGIVKIPFDNLPAEFRTRFGYDVEQAKAFAAKVAQDQQDIYSQTEAEKEKQAKIREAEAHIKENEKRIAANEAKDRAKIEQAIARHDLFIGMTPEQCVQSRGEPDNINVTTTDRGRHEQWVYRDRRYWVSSQAAGSTALATVNDGVAEGWRYLSPCYVYFDNGNSDGDSGFAINDRLPHAVLSNLLVNSESKSLLGAALQLGADEVSILASVTVSSDSRQSNKSSAAMKESSWAAMGRPAICLVEHLQSQELFGAALDVT